MGIALIAVAIASPWIVWLPFVQGSLALDLFGALAIAGAWHGWGRVVARIARRDAPAALTIYWGLAATVMLGGMAVAMHVYDARLLVISGAVAHSADLALRFHVLRDADWRRPRFWVIPATMIAIVAAIAVLGAAAHVTGRPFDDDGSVVAQIGRLADTGTLADAIGYPRATQLGAHAALAALISAFADPIRGGLVDGGLGLALVLALACTRIRPRDASAGTWMALLAILACAFAIPAADFAPLWIPAGLLLALDATLGADRSTRGVLPIALLAGALASLRGEYAAAAIVYLVAAWWRDRRNARRALVLVAAFAAVVTPYAIGRAAAWGHVDTAAQALVSVSGRGLARYALLAAITAVATPLVLLAVREIEGSAARVLAIACTAGIGGVVALGERPFATHLYWPLAIAGFIALAISLAPRRELAGVAFVLALLACVIVGDAQAATGRTTSWSWRSYDWMADVEYARHTAREGGDYDRALEPVPSGETVAVWVARPELLDYARLRVIDLRTPRIARLRESGDRLARLVTASRARWLLVEDDVPVVLDALANEHRTAAAIGATRLVDLR